MIKDCTNTTNLVTQVIDESSSLTCNANSAIDAAMRQELEAIQRKKADAENELKRLDGRRVELEQWVRDLAVTERTLARVLDVDLPDGGPAAGLDGARRKKPANIPSVFDMAVAVIRDRADEFVEGQDIVAGIRMRWWPNVSKNDVIPTLWRLATKDHRLRKEGTKYGLPIKLVSMPVRSMIAG